jgi:endonuclease-3
LLVNIASLFRTIAYITGTQVGFHNRKTEYIKKAAVIMRDKHGGDIPDTFAGLTALPGVGPKMAHLCLSAAWDRTEGIGVDVHVHRYFKTWLCVLFGVRFANYQLTINRITNLWGWVKTTTPEGTREALESWLPRDKWREINFMLVGFGQTICLPRGRKCGDCTLSNGLCRAAFVSPKKVKKKRVVSEDEDEDIPYAKSPVKRQRRKVKVEIKEEEDEDGIIADIEDAIPSMGKYKCQ